MKGVADPAVTVSLYSNATCTSSILAAGSGSTFSGAGFEVAVLDNTTTTFYAKATDSQARASPCSSTSVTYVEDSTAPSPPTGLSVSPLPPANNTNPTVSGTAESNATVRVYSNAICTLLIGQGTANTQGAFSVSVPVNANSLTTLFANQTDVAGNASTCATGPVYVEDSTAPDPPSALTTIPASPANTMSPRVSGVVEPLSFVRIYADSACDGGVLGSGSATTFQYDGGIAVSVTENTTTTFFANATDDAGNRSGCGTGVSFTHSSTILPDAAVVAFVPAPPANNNAPSMTGYSDPGSTVRVYRDGGCVGEVGAAVAAAFANGGIALSGVDDNTTTGFFVRVTDGFGNAGLCQGPFIYTEDSSVPAAPTFTQTRPSSPARWRYPAVVGQAEPGGAVAVYTASACDAGFLAAGSAEQFGDAGLIVTDARGSTTTLYAAVTDDAGNRSACSPAPMTYVEQSPEERRLAAGSFQTCAITDSGGLKCWGSNSVGQIGDGDAGGNRLFPTLVRGFDGGIAAVASASWHVCAVGVDRRLWCWGGNFYGQLGNGTIDASSTPTLVVGLEEGAIDVGAGTDHTCAITTDKLVKCWGRNNRQQLGDAGSDSTVPVAVLGGVATVSPSEQRTCAIADGGLGRGNLYCWGSNETDGGSYLSPFLVGFDAGVKSVVATGYNTCVIDEVGGAWCRGVNSQGQLGNGNDAGMGVLSLTPVVGLASGVAKIALGGSHACAVLENGSLRCWGYNNWGQVGDNTSGTPRWSPVSVSTLSGVTDVVVGNATSCAVAAGAVQCWGYTVLPDGGSYPSPLPMANLTSGVQGISGSADDFCAWKTTGEAYCWGKNYYGQSGTGTTTPVYVPAQIEGASFRSVSVGLLHVCGLSTYYGIHCWGYDDFGEASAEYTAYPRSVIGF
ncbi:MAG: hypothetical protein HYY84_15200 [Deltaproteobacteria bacterium]|nr:hypothetical protein [Deltaproteobacteria bacterium]